MRIYQPMLFVGLGGSGCLIGAELERRLREELCGPDGTELRDRIPGGSFLPFQLPSCLQFVYADLSDASLDQVRRLVVPTEEHIGAADRTMHRAQDLVPRFDTYPEVARSLRTNVGALVAPWLPPRAGEPHVAPLTRGAGQLPTIGRAALFETCRSGIAPAQRPIGDAVRNIATSGGQLTALGGNGRVQWLDVFVAFSVAGGTGAGIFFDYLHLVAHTIARSGLKAQIYPLVLMPSAFTEGMGGGRGAMLNSGRALLDLFRLVDDQNGQGARVHFDDYASSGLVGVTYPSDGELRIRPSTVQTAFLFSRPEAVEREDLHRLIASFVLSLVGTQQDGTDSKEAGRSGDQTYQSFADDFINRGVGREAVAVTGVGNQGVSTALVASMTVPVDELADIVSSRLLMEAVAEMSAPPVGGTETNRTLIERFFDAANLERLRLRTPQDFNEPSRDNGAEPIKRALAARQRTLEASLKALDNTIVGQVSTMVDGFDQRRAVDQLLGEVDIFRLRRVVLGAQSFKDRADQMGFVGLLEHYRREPDAPPGIRIHPPQPTDLRNPLMGRLRWGHPSVREAVEAQDIWYRWRTRRTWHRVWSEQTPRWERAVGQLRRHLVAITDAFSESVHDRDFDARATELYRPRTGVSYLLPPHGLEPFYQATLRRFVTYFLASGQLAPNATAAAILNAILGEVAWRQAYDVGVEYGPDHAVALVRDRVKQAVKRLFRHREPGEQPLLPRLGDLLSAASGKEGMAVGDDDLLQFKQKMVALVPGGFAPQGTGQMRILISYAAGGEEAVRDPEVEQYLRREINLPREQDPTLEFRPITTETIAVVMIRTSMSVTDVSELREVLLYWSDAQREARPHDFLRWRQRLGYDFGYLMTTEEHRVRILHRLLCALWNGRVTAEGDPANPHRITICPPHESVTMSLRLEPFLKASSWGSVLRSYEEWTISGAAEGVEAQARRDFCGNLMATLPVGLQHSPAPPSDLYRVVRVVAAEQPELLADIVRQQNGHNYPNLLLQFWTRTFEAALDLEFEGVNNPVFPTLRLLERAVCDA